MPQVAGYTHVKAHVVRIAPHLTFIADPTARLSESEPPGLRFAQLLATHLSSSGARVNEPDNWRDAGWSVEFAQGSGRLQTYFAPYTEGGMWLLAVAPAYEPGLVSRALGKKPSASVSELKEGCRAIHSAALSAEGISELRWMLGGPPGKARAYATPDELLWEAAL